MTFSNTIKYNILTLFSILLTLGSFDCQAQTFEEYPNIDKILDEMGLDFLMPVENQFSIKKPKNNQFFKYDFRMIDQSKEIETLIALLPENKNSTLMNFPHIKFHNLLANMTPNSDEQQVPVYRWGEKELDERNADWGAEAYFTARRDITKFPHTKLVAFYKEGYGMVVLVHCFDDPKNKLPTFAVFMMENQSN